MTDDEKERLRRELAEANRKLARYERDRAAEARRPDGSRFLKELVGAFTAKEERKDQ